MVEQSSVTQHNFSKHGQQKLVRTHMRAHVTVFLFLIASLSSIHVFLISFVQVHVVVKNIGFNVTIMSSIELDKCTVEAKLLYDSDREEDLKEVVLLKVRSFSMSPVSSLTLPHPLRITHFLFLTHRLTPWTPRLSWTLTTKDVPR